MNIYLDWMKKSISAAGDIIELGVGGGEGSLAMGQFLKDNGIKKKVYACDCFKGLPYTDTEFGVSSDLKKGECFVVTADKFSSMVKDAGLEGIVIPIIGLFENTLESQLSDKQFCYAWVDADLYKSTLVAYDFLKDRLTPGAIMGFHDYCSGRCFGVKKVVDEKLLNNPSFTLVGGESIYIFFQRNELQ